MRKWEENGAKEKETVEKAGERKSELRKDIERARSDWPQHCCLQPSDWQHLLYNDGNLFQLNHPIIVVKSLAWRLGD